MYTHGTPINKEKRKKNKEKAVIATGRVILNVINRCNKTNENKISMKKYLTLKDKLLKVNHGRFLSLFLCFCYAVETL